MAGVEIQELADTAKKSVPYGLTPDKWIEVYNEKFAELIVKECSVALSPMLRDMVSRGQAFDLIKKHFRVD